jgi:hypothetical protein
MNTDQGFIVGQKTNVWIWNHKIFRVIALLTSLILAVIVLPYVIYLASLIPTLKHVSAPILLQLQLVYGQKVPQGASCNCVIDYTSSGHLNNNVTGLTIPKIILLKNQTIQNQIGGVPLRSITARSTQLMGIITKWFFLGNFTGGPGATAALNTINVKPNESLGLKVFGGKIPKPTPIRGEIIGANATANEQLAHVKLVGSKITQFQLLYNKSAKKPVLGINRFLVDVKQPGYYLLLMSLGYNTKANNNSNLFTTGTNITDKFLGNQQSRYPLIAIYETILRIG